MAVFDFNHHTTTTQYPESGIRMQLGGGYMFTAGSTAPDQRILTLHFEDGMLLFRATNGTPDVTTMPSVNFYRLEQFYQAHKLAISFSYTHVLYGTGNWKFNKPLVTPKRIRGSANHLEPFTLEFLEMP
jgi:hypothetical protein